MMNGIEIPLTVVIILTILATIRAIRLDIREREKELLTAKKAKEIIKQRITNYRLRRNGKGLFKPKKR